MGGTSSSGGTQTVEPPKWARPYIERGMGYAQDRYSQTGSIPNVAAQAPETLQAMDHIAGRARYNPITGAQQQLATNTLNGGFLGSNPYLDATFNQAALATQNQLASQFAGAGRNVDASEGLRAQQLNQLATGIYGGAYDAERNRQNQVLGMSPMLQQGAYADYDRLAGVGAARQGYQQQLLDAPEQALDRYIGRVSGQNVGSTTRQTGVSNPAAGALGGAMLGSTFGLGVIPGAILGGIFG